MSVWTGLFSNFFKWLHEISYVYKYLVFVYVHSLVTSIELLLRRTLVRLVSLFSLLLPQRVLLQTSKTKQDQPQRPSLLVIRHQTLHRVFQDFPQVKFIGGTKGLNYIFKSIGHAANKIYRVLPNLIVFVQVLKEKIIQPVFDNVLNHIVPA